MLHTTAFGNICFEFVADYAAIAMRRFWRSKKRYRIFRRRLVGFRSDTVL